MTTTPYLNNLFSLANTAGSLITTAEENVQFWHKLCSGGIINAQSWKEMTQIKSLGGGDGYGLGIFFYNKKMNGRSFYSHGGTFFGFINENMVDTTSGVTIAVLTNQDSIKNDVLLGLVIKALHNVTLNMPATGVRETDALNNNITLYPNPASEKITVRSEAGSFANSVIHILDATGRELHVQAINGNETEINTGALAQGLYMVVIKNKEGVSQLCRNIQVIH